MQRKGNNDQGSNKDGVSDVVVSHSLCPTREKSAKKILIIKMARKSQIRFDAKNTKKQEK